MIDKRVVAAAGVAVVAPLLIYFEGYRERTYLDVVDVPTVCVGHTGPDVIIGKTYTEQECADFLRQDLLIVDAAISASVRVPLTENQRAALQSLILNIGVGAFLRSTLLRLLNLGDYDGAAKQFDRWVLAKGQRIQALVNRRAQERALFEAP